MPLLLPSTTSMSFFAEEVRGYITRDSLFWSFSEQTFVANKLWKQGDTTQLMMSYSTRLCFATGLVLLSAYLVNYIIIILYFCKERPISYCYKDWDWILQFCKSKKSWQSNCHAARKSSFCKDCEWVKSNIYIFLFNVLQMQICVKGVRQMRSRKLIIQCCGKYSCLHREGTKPKKNIQTLTGKNKLELNSKYSNMFFDLPWKNLQKYKPPKT